jgi:hypothetical protein
MTNNCLGNCSFHGYCVYVANKGLVCVCSRNYDGLYCSISTLVCSSYPCLNNGTCLADSRNSSLYKCQCDGFHYGTNCENQINYCKNTSCSGHGTCSMVKNRATCACFNMYTGTSCETTSMQLIITKIVITSSGVIAIITVISTYLLMFVCDLDKYFELFCRGNVQMRMALNKTLGTIPTRRKKKDEIKNPYAVIVKHVYIPHSGQVAPSTSVLSLDRMTPFSYKESTTRENSYIN